MPRGRASRQTSPIVTVEDSRLVEYVRPALTAVHVPMYMVAKRATEVLLAAIAGSERGAGETVGTDFVVRASSAPLLVAKPRRAKPRTGALASRGYLMELMGQRSRKRTH